MPRFVALTVGRWPPPGPAGLQHQPALVGHHDDRHHAGVVAVVPSLREVLLAVHRGVGEPAAGAPGSGTSAGQPNHRQSTGHTQQSPHN